MRSAKGAKGRQCPLWLLLVCLSWRPLAHLALRLSPRLGRSLALPAARGAIVNWDEDQPARAWLRDGFVFGVELVVVVVDGGVVGERVLAARRAGARVGGPAIGPRGDLQPGHACPLEIVV